MEETRTCWANWRDEDMVGGGGCGGGGGGGGGEEGRASVYVGVGVYVVRRGRYIR